MTGAAPGRADASALPADEPAGNSVAVNLHNPIPRTARREEVAEALARYRDGQRRGKEDYAAMVTAFYDLITDFYEFGWGRSFHFAPGRDGESFADSIARHQRSLGEALELRPGMRVLDLGCGVGGPQRFIARRFGVSVVGLNISERQLAKCAAYNRKAGLDDLCGTLHGDFMAIPAEDRSFDAAYQVEATVHAPDKTAAYREVFRVLRPGAVFAGYEWCVTPLYDAGDPEHRDIGQRIEYGNALPRIASFADIAGGLRAAGFERIETRDCAPDADPRTPWYRPLEGNGLTPRGLPRTPLGRRVTGAALGALEAVRAVPRGSTAIQELLNLAADSLVAAGRLGIFTPMYFHKARKPGPPAPRAGRDPSSAPAL